jgi:multidrug efflux pump subunit AcrB
MRHGLFDFLSEQRRFVYLAVALISAAGMWAAFSLPSAIYPELTFPRIIVVAEGSALGARQVVFTITRPIEEAVSVVPGVTRVRSRTIRGGSEINITFAPHADMVYALQQTQARVNQIRSQLPADLSIEVATRRRFMISRATRSGRYCRVCRASGESKCREATCARSRSSLNQPASPPSG